jgi:hypothetical protein
MAKDPRKRQRKLERRSAKRKEKKHHLVREAQAGLGERLTAASKYPVLPVRVTENLWTEGLGQVILARELPGGQVALAVFLVDRYCLGVKDAFGRIISRYEYDSEYVRRLRSEFAWREVSPATARKFVEDAAAYAHELGFEPHPDYQKASLLFGDIDAGQATEQLEFGKDGKPMFIAGPYDTPQRCQYIIKTLTRTRGPGQFHFATPVSSTEGSEPIDEDDEFDDFEDE